MPFPQKIAEALVLYEQQKGPVLNVSWDHPAIRALNQLQTDQQDDLYEIAQCFVSNTVPDSRFPSYKVYRAFLETIVMSAPGAANEDAVHAEGWQVQSLLENRLELLGKVFDWLLDIGLLTGEQGPKNLQLFVEHANTLYMVLLWFYPSRDLLTQSNWNLLTQHVEYADKLANEMRRSRGVTHCVEEQCNIELLAQPVEYFDKLVLLFSFMNQERLFTGDKELAIQELLVQHAAHAEKLYEGLCIFQRSGLLEGSQETVNTRLLSQYAEHADKLAMGFSSLYQEGLFDNEEKQTTQELLVQHAALAMKIAIGLQTLKHCDSRLLQGDCGQANRECLAQHAEHARPVADGLVTLYKNGLLECDQGQENRVLITQYAEYADRVAEGLSSLHRARMLTGDHGEEYRHWLAQHAEYAVALADGLSKLDSAGWLMGDQRKAHQKLLVRCTESAINTRHIVSLLLHINNPQILIGTEQNTFTEVQRKMMIKAAAYNKGVARSMLFSMLKAHDLLSQTEISELRQYQFGERPPTLQILCAHATLFNHIDFEKEPYLPETQKTIIRDYASGT